MKMDKLKIAVVGAGSIAQVVHLPVLKSIDDVELVAICDVDEAKIMPLVDKFKIPRWYGQIDQLVKREHLDAIHICTSNHYHYPMAYLALKNNINVFLEKPIALNAADAQKLDELARAQGLEIMVGMQNRFRDDVQVLRDFIAKGELGEIFHIKSGWLKQYSRHTMSGWKTSRERAGGGVVLDLGSQLIDKILYLLGMPEIKSVRLYDYTLNPEYDVEDSALAMLETKQGTSIAIETSWRTHLEKDMIYTHVFGSKGAAYLNPLRINKEMHGNLVNVTPYTSQKSSADRFTKSYQTEIQHFVRLLRGEKQNFSSSADAVKIMRILDALYESGRTKKQIELE